MGRVSGSGLSGGPAGAGAPAPRGRTGSGPAQPAAGASAGTAEERRARLMIACSVSDGCAPLRKPVVDAGEVELDLLAPAAGIVGADHLDRRAVSAGAGLGDDHAIVRLMDGADAGEADLESHGGIRKSGRFLESRTEDRPCPLCQPLVWPVDAPHFPLTGPGAGAMVGPLMLKTGIVGLPNVGKSTLFNALTRSRKAEAANYPFCTIDPNVGVVTVPDDRLPVLQKIAKTNVVIPAAIEFVDIAGLVAGASKGEGLGNQFLSHIREVDAIVHVVRCFEDPDIIHTMGGIDPVRDIEVITTELILADLDAVQKRIDKTQKKAKSGDKEAQAELGAPRAAGPAPQRQQAGQHCCRSTRTRPGSSGSSSS